MFERRRSQRIFQTRSTAKHVVGTALVIASSSGVAGWTCTYLLHVNAHDLVVEGVIGGAVITIHLALHRMIDILSSPSPPKELYNNG